MAAAIALLSLALALFQFYSTYFGQSEGHAHRSTHLAFMLLLAFLVFPLGRKTFPAPLSWPVAVDLAAIAVVLAAQIWTLVHLDRFVDPNYAATTGDVVLGTLLILVVLEGTRRTVGWGLTLTAVFFLVQTWRADWFFWIFYGPPTSWWTMVESFFGKEEGLYGIPIAIMSSVLILFIFFSAFLAATGIGDFFVRLATALAGRLVGGPAKVSVFSSALFGTISGSGVANVMVDGVFTIPMMKRIGYGATFAAAVEATASIGGQIMPPIMAAAAFIMADLVGVPFRQVAVAAIIPAVLYFFCVFMTVHFEARRLGLSRVPPDEMPRFGATRLGAVLYIVPFMFVYSPALLAIGTWPEILFATLTAGVGVFCLSAGLQGWLLRATTPAERTLLLGAALALVVPGLYTDLTGFGLLGFALLFQSLRGRRQASGAIAHSLD